MTGRSVLLRHVELGGSIVDVRCEDGRITHVGPGAPGAEVDIDAGGGAILPGLHDHHIHLLALAAARASIQVGPPEVRSPETLDRVLREAAARAAPDAWLRAVGYHESVSGPLDRLRLDALVGDRRVRVQHASGAMWVLNSAALAATGIEGLADPGIVRDDAGRATGRLFGLDAVVRDRTVGAAPDVAAVGRELAGYGVIGVTDLTPTDDAGEIELLGRKVLELTFPVGVLVTGGPALDPRAAPDLQRGPVKFVVADHRLPSIDELVAGFRKAHGLGRAVAVHCVTRAALLLALAAWQDAGSREGDRIEHGAVIPLAVVATIRDLGLVVVTQPSFVGERGDRYLADVDAADVEDLWRCGSLIRHGVGVAASTDAPFGHADPWRAIAHAASRTTPSGVVLGAGERVPARRALDLFLTEPGYPAGPPRRVEVGARAELCLLDRPLADALVRPSSGHVRATVSRAGYSGAG